MKRILRSGISTMLLTLLFSLCLFPQSPYTDSFSVDFLVSKIVLPIKYRGGANPVIMLKVNGKGPYKFMFDTGSPGFLKLDEELFNQLQLPVTDSVYASDGSGLNGRSYPLTNLKTVELDAYKISNVTAMVRNYNPRKEIDSINGVIGLSFFKNVLLELNFENNELILTKGKLNAGDNSVYAIKTLNDVPSIPVMLSTGILEAIFDTGNMGWLTLHSSNITSDMLQGEPRVVGKAKTISNEFEIKEAKLNKDITFGKLVFEKPVIIINDVIPRTNAGVRFLKQMNITFDMTNNLVKLVKFPPKFSEIKTSVLNEYTGKYEGERVITLNDKGELFIKRAEGTTLKMVFKNKDEYGLEIVPGAVLKFERDNSGKVIALNVNRGDNNWEKALKTN